MPFCEYTAGKNPYLMMVFKNCVEKCRELKMADKIKSAQFYVHADMWSKFYSVDKA